MKNVWRIALSLSLVFCVLLSVLMPVSAAETKTTAQTTETEEDITVNQAYKKYSEKFAEYDFGAKKVLTADNISAKSKNSKISKSVKDSGKGGIIVPDDGFVSWKITADKNVKYAILVTYAAAEFSSGNIELGLNIDGEIPFSNVSIVSFERIYSQAKGEFATNAAGNHLKPNVEEIFKWQSKYVSDASGYSTEPFIFGFKKGTHEITLNGSRGAIAINKIELVALEETKTYKEYINSLKLDHAKKLVVTTSASIKEICFASGFNSFTNFLRAFKENYGVSPGVMRSQNKNN